MPLYRYRPHDNRTPVSHPLYGALVWDKLVRWHESIADPDFEEVPEEESQPAGKTKVAPDANAAPAAPAADATDTAPKKGADSAPADDGSK